MDKLLFGERGTKKMEDFGRRIKWFEIDWKYEGYKGEEVRKGRKLVEKMKGMGGHLLGMTEEEREEVRKSERERMRKYRNLVTQATTPNTSVVTGTSRLTKRMKEDGWYRNERKEIVKKGEDGVRERRREIMGIIHGNKGRVGKKKKV